MIMMCHDPRIGKKVKTKNQALINAEKFRKQWPKHKIDWDKVARYADQCDKLEKKK